MNTDRSGNSFHAAAPSRTDNPYDRPNFGTEPHAIYFYYIKPGAMGSETKLYFFKDDKNSIIEADVPGRVKDIIENPRDPKDNSFIWRKKSYLAVVVDDPDWQFADEGIKFVQDGHFHKNHTFYHAKHTSITVKPRGEQERELALLYCINHMKKSAKDDDSIDRGKRQCFRFKVYQKPTPGARSLGPYEADGTNLGPPVPPPPSAGFLKRLILHWLEKLGLLSK